MLKAGLLPAPVISPQRHDSYGARVQIDKNSFIEIRCDAPNTKIFFTVDGNKPSPFQANKTGRSSTIKYIGAFRLQPGNRVVKAIAVSRDMLRESTVSTKYIEVFDTTPLNQFDNNEVEYIDDEEEYRNHRSRYESNPYRERSKSPFNNGNDYQNGADLQGSIEGPINPTNYAGTQINIWGFPPADLGSLIDPSRSQMGFMTEQMINRLNTPRYPQVEMPKGPKIEEIEYPDKLQNFHAFCKQLERLYEKDRSFKNNVDKIVELSALKNANVVDKNDAFVISLNWPKFKPTIVQSSPSPPPRHRSPPIIIEEKPIKKPVPEVTRKPEPVPVPVPAPKPKPAPVVEPEKPKEPVIYREELQQQGTLVPAPEFNPDLDCEALKYAVKGLGTKEDIIINIMGNRSNDQRMKIKELYKTMFGKELVEDLKGDTSGNFKKLLVGLLMTSVEYDCYELNKAIKGLGTDDSVLVELLSSRSNSRLKEMSALYPKLYKRKMEDDVSGDTSGDYRKLLMSLLTANRPETNEVDMSRVEKDVDELIAAGIKKWGTDESKFNAIFGMRSYAHLKALFEEYKRKSKVDIEASIKSEMSGNLSKTYLALISNIRNRPAYFAKEIKKAVKGLGTNESTLNRIFISRCEVDMIQIKNEYEKLFKTTLEKDVKDDVSGEYGALLLLLAKDPSQRVYDPIKIGGKKDELIVATGPHQIEQVEEPVFEETPTLRAASGFDANDDCERLRKAMKGLGTDEKAIIAIVCKRSNEQRLQLKTIYQQMFGKDLVKELDSELSGHFRDMILGLMMSPPEFDAWAYRKAIKGLGTDEKALIELLTTRSSEQINAAKDAFKRMYNKNLEDEIKSDTSGNFRKVLVSLLTASRPTGNMVDLTQSDVDAQNLINLGIKKLGTDESRFIVILCSRSFANLRAVFQAYAKRTGNSLSKDIEKEFSGDLKNAFLSIIDCIVDKQAHFSQLLYNSMKGLGTNENTIVRILVSRCEIDMVQMKQKFQDLYKQTLVDFLKGDISGDFLKASLTLIGEEGSIKK